VPLITFDSVSILYFCVGVLFAITAQGAAQGITIEIFRVRTDDETDRPQLNLNFYSYLDPIALLVFFLGGFGWPRAIRVDDRDFRNPAIAWLVIAFAGAFTNLLIAVSISTISDILWTSKAFQVVMLVNAAVFVYHVMVPIPPLAASRLIYALIPRRYNRIWQWYYKLGPFLLLALVGIEQFTKTPILSRITKPYIDAIMRFCS
jgi:Zn-dependent protease